MIISAKHRVMLWVPSMIFIYLVLGNLERDSSGGMAYRVFTGGLICSVLLFAAALLITRGERAPIAIGILCWVLAIIALLAIDTTTLLVMHF